MVKRGIDINRTDKYGNTALHYIFKQLKEPNIDIYHKMTEKLLNMSMKINCKNKDGETALIQAIKKEV